MMLHQYRDEKKNNRKKKKKKIIEHTIYICLNSIEYNGFTDNNCNCNSIDLNCGNW